MKSAIWTQAIPNWPTFNRPLHGNINLNKIICFSLHHFPFQSFFFCWFTHSFLNHFHSFFLCKIFLSPSIDLILGCYMNIMLRILVIASIEPIYPSVQIINRIQNYCVTLSVHIFKCYESAEQNMSNRPNSISQRQQRQKNNAKQNKLIMKLC